MQNTPHATDNVAPSPSIGEMITDYLRHEIAAQIAVVLNVRPSVPLDRRQVAELLKISLPTLKKRTDDGSIHCTRIGRRVLFDRSEIESLLALKSDIAVIAGRSTMGKKALTLQIEAMLGGNDA